MLNAMHLIHSKGKEDLRNFQGERERKDELPHCLY